MKILLNAAEVEWSPQYTITRFWGGASIVSDHSEQKGQTATAEKLGMSVEKMNQTHDLTHSLLAFWLGMPNSPTLKAVAKGNLYLHNAAEEEAVLAIQRWANLAGVDLLKLAKGIGDVGQVHKRFSLEA